MFSALVKVSTLPTDSRNKRPKRLPNTVTLNRHLATSKAELIMPKKNCKRKNKSGLNTNKRNASYKTMTRRHNKILIKNNNPKSHKLYLPILLKKVPHLEYPP